MEIGITQQGTLEFLIDKGDLFTHLLSFGFSIGVAAAVAIAVCRLGWKMWPGVLLIGFVAFMVL